MSYILSESAAVIPENTAGSGGLRLRWVSSREGRAAGDPRGPPPGTTTTPGLALPSRPPPGVVVGVTLGGALVGGVIRGGAVVGECRVILHATGRCTGDDLTGLTAQNEAGPRALAPVPAAWFPPTVTDPSFCR